MIGPGVGKTAKTIHHTNTHFIMTSKCTSAATDAVFLLCLPLQVRDELADRDLLRHLVVEILTVEHHRLQDGEGPLQHRRVHRRLVHVAGDLWDRKVGGGGRREEQTETKK